MADQIPSESRHLLQSVITEISNTTSKMQYNLWLLSKEEISAKTHQRQLDYLNIYIKAIDTALQVAQSILSKNEE